MTGLLHGSMLGAMPVITSQRYPEVSGCYGVTSQVGLVAVIVLHLKKTRKYSLVLWGNIISRISSCHCHAFAVSPPPSLLIVSRTPVKQFLPFDISDIGFQNKLCK